MTRSSARLGGLNITSHVRLAWRPEIGPILAHIYTSRVYALEGTPLVLPTGSDLCRSSLAKRYTILAR